MKKTRRVLSLILSVLVAVGSMPMLYMVTGAAEDVSAFALDVETGTLENPTRPVEASGVIEREDLYKLNINSQNTSYTFYQTKDDEYFIFGQTQGLQNYYETSVSNRTLTFEGITYYEGASEMNGNTDPIEVSAGFGRWEYPLITSNPTSEFLSKYYVSNTWTPTNGNAEGAGSFPFVLDGSWADIGGCKVYTWQNETIFKGNSASESGEINTGYYEQLKWNWVSSESSARFDLRIGTTLRILDARKLAEEIAKAEEILANADNYTDEYVSSVQATLNTIPEDLRDFSKVYDQSVIDNYTQMMENISLNSADYTEYNTVYASLKGINNSKGAFTDESFAAFKAELDSINANLPKNLDKTQQATVDAATQALRDAYNILVATDVSKTEDSYYFQGTDNSGNVDITVKNVNLKFMQTKDNQQFSFTQSWILNRTGGSNKRIIYRVTIDDTYPLYCGNTSCQSIPDITENKTSEFLARMNSGYTSLTADDADGTSFTANEFTTWASNDGLVSNGMFTHEVGLEKKSYTATVTPTFVGNSATESGEITTNFVQRIGYKYYTGLFQYKYRHFHVNSTVTVTDVRRLIDAVADAKETLANPGAHSEAYLTALEAAVDSVPVEMLRGVDYYTQAEVDKLYNDITTIPEEVADYSEFVEVFHMMTSLNADKYTEESYNTFINEIYSVNRNLAKNLTADNQSTVDAAVDALYAAYDKLVSCHLNEDNVFTQDDISETGYSPLEFSVSSTEYNFMQTVDGQTFAIRTDLTVRNAKTRYTCNLLSLRFSNVSADTVSSVCDARETPDAGCHNGENVLVNQSEIVLSAVTGVTTYTANDAGDIGEHTTWVNTSGTPLSTNGILNDPTTLSSTKSSAYAEFYYTAASGDQENVQTVNAQIAYRLGWSYSETVLGVKGETVRRHAHIPVTIRITDARALHTLYGQVEDILSGDTDKNYTFETLANLYYVFNNIDEKMANGDAYYTQEEVNAEYEALKAAFNALEEGADYSEYFDVIVEAQKIVGSNNDDGYGNKLFDEDAYNEFVSKVTEIDGNLEKNLSDTPENQQKIDTATQQVIDALNAINATKRADYTALEEAIIEAQKIINATEGTYTESTYEDLVEALNNAIALDRNLYADQQSTVDALTSALENAIAGMEFKADYSEFNDAYSQVQDIVNNPDNYSAETVTNAQNALAQADKLNKDLPDTAENRQTIKDATDALKAVLDSAEKKADYTDFDKAVEDLENIVNAPDGTYTEETVKNAQDALDSVAGVDKDLSESEQDVLDEITSGLQDVINSAKEKADYTDYNNAKNEADNLVNDDGNGNPIYDEDAFNEYKEAVENIDNALNKGLSKEDQSIVDDATNALEELKNTLENNKLADYTDFDAAKDALEEIVNAPAGTYTDETVQKAQDALDNANNIPSDMVVGENNANQNIIDQATQNMQDVIDSAEKKADYTDFDKAVEDLENIVNAPEGTYTEETVKNAQDALDSIVDVDKNLADTEQDVLDEITSGLKDVVDSAEKKADYTEFDKVVEDLEDIVNAPDGTYTDETVKNAQDALDSIVDVDKDFTESEQDVLDEITAGLKDVVDSAKEKADYSDYNDAKSEADNLVNDDGNGNPIYDEEAFNEYKEAIENIDNALEKDLSKDDQSIVDDATSSLENLKTQLEEKKYYTVTYLDADGNVIATDRFVAGSTFGELSAPALPEDTDALAYVGWVSEGALVSADDVLSGDITVQIAREDKVLNLNNDALSFHTSTGYITSEVRDMTVAEFIAMFANDADCLEVKDLAGNVLASDDLVGTGAVITLKSKYTDNVYDSETVVVYGDVTGDGLVNADDYSKAKLANIIPGTYNADNYYFFVANDVMADGYIDALDSSYINLMVRGYK